MYTALRRTVLQHGTSAPRLKATQTQADLPVNSSGLRFQHNVSFPWKVKVGLQRGRQLGLTPRPLRDLHRSGPGLGGRKVRCYLAYQTASAPGCLSSFVKTKCLSQLSFLPHEAAKVQVPVATGTTGLCGWYPAHTGGRASVGR